MISKKTITGKSHDHSPDNKGQCVKCDRLLSLEEHVNWYCKKYSVKIPLTRPLKPTTGLLVPAKSPAKGFTRYSTAELMKLYKDFMEDSDIKNAMEEIAKKREEKIRNEFKKAYLSEFTEEFTENIVSDPEIGTLRKKLL